MDTNDVKTTCENITYMLRKGLGLTRMTIPVKMELDPITRRRVTEEMDFYEYTLFREEENCNCGLENNEFVKRDGMALNSVALNLRDSETMFMHVFQEWGNLKSWIEKQMLQDKRVKSLPVADVVDVPPEFVLVKPEHGVVAEKKEEAVVEAVEPEIEPWVEVEEDE